MEQTNNEIIREIIKFEAKRIKTFTNGVYFIEAEKGGSIYLLVIDGRIKEINLYALGLVKIGTGRYSQIDIKHFNVHNREEN